MLSKNSKLFFCSGLPIQIDLVYNISKVEPERALRSLLIFSTFELKENCNEENLVCNRGDLRLYDGCQR